MKRNKSLKWIIFKTKIENLFLDIIFLTLPLVIALMFNLLLEMFIFVISYTFIRLEFTKAVHGSDFTKSPSKAIWICRLITTVVQLISIIVVVKLDISKYVNILLAVVLGVINHFVRDWKDKNELLQKKLESLTFEEMKARFTSMSEYDLKCVYAYINRGSKNADNIAMKYKYSTRQIQRIIKKMREGI